MWFRFALWQPREDSSVDKLWNIGLHTPNPERKSSLFDYQNEHLEHRGKKMGRQDANTVDLGYALEAAGDIFREVAQRRGADVIYVAEKLRKIHRIVDDPSSPIWLGSSVLTDSDRQDVGDYIARWQSIAGQLKPGGILETTMYLCLSIVSQDREGSAAILSDLEGLLFTQAFD